MADPRQDYLALVDEVTEHDRRYHVEAAPTISDVEYDALAKRLRELEAQHPDWVVEWSPTRRVGHAPVSEFPKVERPVAMLSLDNTYGEDDLREFHERVLRGLDGVRRVHEWPAGRAAGARLIAIELRDRRLAGRTLDYIEEAAVQLAMPLELLLAR